MFVRGKRVVVIGLGRSGVAAARLLLAQGAEVVAVDAAPRDKLSKAALGLAKFGAELEPRSHGEAALAYADLAVISPGVPTFPALEVFERSGREVISEMELGSRFVEAPIALIGGTNGKSTTTALAGAILEAAGKRTFVGGNFGTPLSEVVDKPWDVLVLEISSFQAERVPTLHARAHALLNVSDDHLDRYDDLAEYADAKGNPFMHMNAGDLAVIPHGNPICARQAKRGAANSVTFSATDREADVCLDGDRLVHRPLRLSVPKRALKLEGLHNVANACAAIAVAAHFDLGSPARAQAVLERALSGFKGLEHRTVLVAELDGVKYYDDSKGTNVGATVTALRGLLEPKAVLIAGGRDKLGSYDPLVAALRDKGRGLVVIGEAAGRIAAGAAGLLPIMHAASMKQAVQAARELARRGDAVLLSPACSSFDMFRDYKDRGDAFVKAVLELAEPEEWPT